MKSEESTKELEKYHIDVAILSETKKGKGPSQIGNYWTIYFGVEKTEWAQSRIWIAIKNIWKNKKISYSCINKRIITLYLKMGKNSLTIIGVSASTIGRKEKTEIFYNHLQDIIRKNKQEGSDNNIWQFKCKNWNGDNWWFNWTTWWTNINENRVLLGEFCTYNKLRITNSFCKHKDIYKFTSEECDSKSIIVLK